MPQPRTEIAAARLAEHGLDPKIQREELDNFLATRYNGAAVAEVSSRSWIAQDCLSNYSILRDGAEKFINGVRFTLALKHQIQWQDTAALMGVLDSWSKDNETF